jgi:Uma2 family endonuclease
MATQAVTSLPLHRLDVETYSRMVDCGALEGAPVELLEGWLVEVSPQSPRHAEIIEDLTRHLASAQARLRVQLPFEVLPDSVPEPDLALVEGRSSDHHPRTALLVVEVAVSSYAIDRGLKAHLYARAGVPTYWLVNMSSKTVEVRTEPGPDGYLACESYQDGALVPSPGVGVAELDVASLFEPAGR